MKKILIANRGEIALRIIRTCREMGINTVAVFSEADRTAPFVLSAGEAVCIGPPPSKESYLNSAKIISAARNTGADAIHPGYGFLSENFSFAKEVNDAGIIFIGPPPDAIQKMGDKIAAKAMAKKLNVPLVPGTEEPVISFREAEKASVITGFPLLIKAAAGGGGKGMRIVHRQDDLEESFDRAVSEAENAFGNGSVFIEKYITSPRHIEFQVLADNFGNVVHLNERECSVQRRHQKVIEEAPSVVVSPELRRQMGKCAVEITRASGYCNAGTVEFLVDEKLNYYFLEMNTRLQVEHPVTEFVTGIDLVKEQIRVAAGEKLSFLQEQIVITGHAIEARVYAEDPANNFLPDIGTMVRYRKPHGAGIRVDDGYEEGMEIPIYYDPMIAKLISFGTDRHEAIARMIRAIDDYRISGVETTLPFCRFVMEHTAFISGQFDTHFVEKYFSPGILSGNQPKDETISAILAGYLLHNHSPATAAVHIPSQEKSSWLRRKKYR